MATPPRLVNAFLDGRREGFVVIAVLPGDLGAYIGAISSEVLIERQYAVKIMERHRLAHSDFGLIQVAISEGWCVLNRARAALEFLYEDSRKPNLAFLLALKSAEEGREVWVRTFHRMDPKAIRSRLRRGEIIRYYLPLNEFEE